MFYYKYLILNRFIINYGFPVNRIAGKVNEFKCFKTVNNIR